MSHPDQLPPIPADQFDVALMGIEEFMDSGVVAAPARAALHLLISKTIDAKPSEEQTTDPFYGLLDPYIETAARLSEKDPDDVISDQERELLSRLRGAIDVGKMATAAGTVEERDNARKTFGEVFVRAPKAPKQRIPRPARQPRPERYKFR